MGASWREGGGKQTDEVWVTPFPLTGARAAVPLCGGLWGGERDSVVSVLAVWLTVQPPCPPVDLGRTHKTALSLATAVVPVKHVGGGLRAG